MLWALGLFNRSPIKSSTELLYFCDRALAQRKGKPSDKIRAPPSRNTLTVTSHLVGDSLNPRRSISPSHLFESRWLYFLLLRVDLKKEFAIGTFRKPNATHCIDRKRPTVTDSISKELRIISQQLPRSAEFFILFGDLSTRNHSESGVSTGTGVAI
jgi:hypothetical protein